MGYKISDKDYYALVAWVFKILRSACLALITAIVILSLTVYKNDVTSENFKYILRNIDFDVSSVSMSDSMQVSFKTSGGVSAAYIRGDIALLSRQGYETYDFNGMRVISDTHSFSNPALKTSERFALAYDVAGTELDIYNAFSNVYEGKFPYGVFNACINNDGSFAVVTAESSYKSGVVVYNSSFAEVFRWMSATQNVTCVDMPGNKNEVLTAGVTVDNGEFVTEINLFDTSKDKPKATVKLNDEFPMAAEYTENGFFLLSDRALSIFDSDGKLLSRNSFVKGSVMKYFNCGRFTAITVSEGISDAETLHVFSESGNESYSETFEGGVLDMSVFGSTAYILEPGKLNFRNITYRSGEAEFKEKNVPSISVDTLISRVFASGTDEYILMSPNGAGKYR